MYIARFKNYKTKASAKFIYFSGSEVKYTDIEQIHSVGHDRSYIQDFRSTELLNTPVEEVFIKKNTEEKIMKPIELEFPDIKTFINFLGLNEYFPDKMQVRHVMTIQRSVKAITFEEIALMFVRNIIMNNLNGRDKLVQENLRKKFSSETSFNSSDELFENIKVISRSLNREINPLDLTIAVFKCASPILIHVLASKFFSCQLAMPFAFPKYCDEEITLSLIPLKSVVIECRTKEESIHKVSLECPCHVVSFVRFGYLSVSKSKLVNEILNDQYHSTFFDRDCPLGSSSRYISDGLIEAAWYLPSKKSFLSCVATFLNLRGDAHRFQEQLRIISNISSVLVILIELNNLDENIIPSNLVSLLDNVKLHGIIIAIDAKNNNENDLYRKCKALIVRIQKYKVAIKFCILEMNGQMRSRADIKEEIRECILKMVDTKPLSSISERLISSNLKIKEDIGYYQDVQQHVQVLWEIFPDTCAHVKQQVIPVQGKHWEAWSKKLKKFQNSSQYKSQKDAGTIQKDMIDERQKQLELCKKINPFMKTFIHYLWQFSENENKCHVFVILLKSLLDERSRKTLPTFQLQYLADWKEMMLAKQQQKEQSNIDQLLTKVKSSERNLFEASFGFEHLCRELGQIFEASSECETKHKKLKEFETVLPKLAVRLLLMGQPFELMDGDVANVPLLWMKAVFRELKQSLGDKKLLTLSVLGIQSSGKSTLLNTMFGLKFAVSAGRCTRGVYVQLMPVESGAFPFDFILVVDTEGLRALELADLKYSRDNELATFVVGLGDITIVNIKGENTTEVQDVLQIVVHAFLRLKLANKKSSLKKRCIFAHQNVPAQDANEKMRHGRQKIIEILDKMTEEAATQEQISDIKTFNDVIQVDIEKDVWYFSDLWRGDPPMAPANPGYSETVASALGAITNRLIVERETYLTITDTVTRIEDLWQGILTDDFVFNFRNCLEVKAFNNMERQFQSLTWEIEQKVREFIKAEAKISLMTCNRPEDFNTQIPKIFLQLSNMVNNDLHVGTTKLDLFIENNCLKEIMIQWQKNKHRKFVVFGEELITQAQMDIFNMKEEMKIEKIRMTDKREHECEINRQAQQLAVSMKGTFPKQNVIEQAFNEMWKGWISQFDTKAIQHGLSIKEQIQISIHNRFPTDVAYLMAIDQSWLVYQTPYQTITKLENVYSKNSISTEHFYYTDYMKKNLKIDEFKNQVIEVVNVIFRKIDSKLSKLHVQDIKFNILYVKEILEIINDAFEEHNEHKNNSYQFNLTNVCRASVCTHVKNYLVIFFENLDKKYNAKHSPKAVMEEYKGTVWKLFTNTVHSKTADVIAVGFFREALIKEIDKNVSGLMPIDVQCYILSMFPFRKFGLIKDILTKITEKDFSEMKSYIQDPLEYSTKWITDITNKYIFEDRENGSTKYASLAITRIEYLFVEIAKAITDASEVCEKTNCKTISKWIDNFVRNVNNNKFPISNDTMVHVKSRSDTNVDSFIEMLNQELEDIKIEVVTLFENRTKENVLWDENPIPKIMLKLWGCSENCMFCKEPCINTDKDHVELGYDHECLQHRPQGIGGYTWSNTTKLCEEFCNNLVGSEQSYSWNAGKYNEERRKYKDYKKHFPDWNIPHSHDKSQYWMWIMCKYKYQFAQMYSKEQPDIPENWPLITKAQAIESLSVYMAD